MSGSISHPVGARAHASVCSQDVWSVSGLCGNQSVVCSQSHQAQRGCSCSDQSLVEWLWSEQVALCSPLLRRPSRVVFGSRLLMPGYSEAPSRGSG